jgi:hypothetical protein
MGIIFLPDDHSLLIYELEPGQVSPPDAMWVGIGPRMGGNWELDGNLPEDRGIWPPWGEYRSMTAAYDAAIAYAHKVKLDELYIEIDARRC